MYPLYFYIPYFFQHSIGKEDKEYTYPSFQCFGSGSGSGSGSGRIRIIWSDPDPDPDPYQETLIWIWVPKIIRDKLAYKSTKIIKV